MRGVISNRTIAEVAVADALLTRLAELPPPHALLCPRRPQGFDQWSVGITGRTKCISEHRQSSKNNQEPLACRFFQALEPNYRDCAAKGLEYLMEAWNTEGEDGDEVTKRRKELEAKNAFKGEALAKLTAFASKVEVPSIDLGLRMQRKSGVDRRKSNANRM